MAGGNDSHAREAARQAGEREKARKAAEAEAKRKAREEKLANEAARAQEAVDRTSVTGHDAEQLSQLLRTSVVDGRPLTFERSRPQAGDSRERTRLPEAPLKPLGRLGRMKRAPLRPVFPNRKVTRPG